MSGEVNGLTVDLEAVVDRGHVGDVGVPASATLLAYTNAVELGGDIDGTRSALAAEIGAEATMQAAATIAVFNGLVRVADGTGIKLDDGVFTVSAPERELLGINRYAGAINSADVRVLATEDAPHSPIAVSDLFG